ncbi:hypothetical protein T265_15790, partial [Opisthorchis viverrini]
MRTTQRQWQKLTTWVPPPTVRRLNLSRFGYDESACLVGRKFSPSSSDYTSRMSSVEAAVYKEKLSVSAATCFVPRSYHEPVLNCTHVPRDVTQLVSHRIFTELLRQPPNLDWLHSYRLVVSESGQIQTSDGRWWNPG